MYFTHLFSGLCEGCEVQLTEGAFHALCFWDASFCVHKVVRSPSVVERFHSKQNKLSSFSHLSGGLMIPWRRRWCVLKDETFMWFRAKQDSLKSGWLYKKGGGMSTLSRRNWKMRWFVLRESKLMYFENDSEEKLKGTIDIRAAK